MEDAEAFADKIDKATSRVVRDYARGKLKHEEPFSGELCGRLKETLEEFETPNFRWQVEATDESSGRGELSARNLTKGGEEPLYGADIVMTIDVEAPDFAINKGFLVQAKRLEWGKDLASDRREKLVEQCIKMLEVTPSSMVFLYSSHALQAIPAAAVLANQGKNLWSIPTWGYRYLFIDFAMCWFGDPRLQTVEDISLDALRQGVDAKAALNFVGRPITDGFDFPRR